MNDLITQKVANQCLQRKTKKYCIHLSKFDIAPNSENPQKHFDNLLCVCVFIILYDYKAAMGNHITLKSTAKRLNLTVHLTFTILTAGRLKFF